MSLRQAEIPGMEEYGKGKVPLAVYSVKVSIDDGFTLSLSSMQEKTVNFGRKRVGAAQSDMQGKSITLYCAFGKNK